MVRPVLATMLATTACTVDPPSLVQDLDIVAPDAERLAVGAPSLALLPGERILTSDGASLWLSDPRTVEALDLGIEGTEVRGGVWLDGDVLAATEHGLFLWDGLVWPSPLQAAIGEPATALLPDDTGAWWILDDGGWRRRAAREISRITVGGVPARGPIALDGRIGATAVTWLTSRDGPDDPFVVAIDASGTLLDSTVYEDVRSLGADVNGHAWVADGRRLHDRHPDGTWSAHTFSSAVAEIRANAASERIWVRTVDGVYTGTQAGVGPVEIPEGRWLGVDRLGRLLLADADGVARVSIDLPVAVVDLPDGPIDEATTVTVAPSLAAQVSSVEVALDGAGLVDDPPAEPPWSFAIDPSAWSPGDHTLEVVVTYADGRSTRLDRELVIGAGLITWEEHIRVLFEDRCAQCHGGTSETVLDTPEAWIARFDRILELVETQQMPLGLEPLASSDVAMIRAWRDGDFQ